MFHTCVVSVLSGCCAIVFASVSDVCFKCFICIFLYVANVVSGCFKSRSGVSYGMKREEARAVPANARRG
jgi:hypothetical protein